jgi:threonine dehydrogenase-like Zn-dependent dehydrogenase
MQDATKGIAGHEGAGEVVKVADDVKDVWQVGKLQIMNSAASFRTSTNHLSFGS